MNEAISNPIRCFRGTRSEGYPRKVTTHYDDGTIVLLLMTRAGRRKSPDGFEWGYSGSGPTALAMALCFRAVGTERGPTAIAVRDSLISPIESDDWELPLSRILDTIARQRSGR